MKLTPQIPLAFLLLWTTLPVWAQNNPPVTPPCSTSWCEVVRAPTGTMAYTNIQYWPDTNICLGDWFCAAPITDTRCSTVITRWPWAAPSTNCPTSYFTNVYCPEFITNWWVVSSPGFSGSGEDYGWGVCFQPTNCGWGTITFYGTWINADPCTGQPIRGGTTSKSLNFYVGNVQIFEPWKAVCTNGSTSFTLTNTCGTVTWEVSPIVPGGPYANGSTIYAGTNCGTYAVTARSTVNTNCTGSTTLYVVELDSIAVDTTYVSSNNWAAVKTNSATEYVTLTANLCPYVTNAAVLLNWSGGGETVPDNPLQRRVHKNASVKTTVTASCCGNSTNVNIWIIWSDLTVKTSGTLDSDDKASVLNNGNFPTANTTYGSYDLGGGKSLGAIDWWSVTNLNYRATIGKMEAKAVLQPSGVGNVVTNGWRMRRTVVCIFWDNGGSPSYRSGGTTPPSAQGDTGDPYYQYLYPINGDIFDLDWPGCPLGTAINHTGECYDNFYEYVTVNLMGIDEVCSTTNTWSYAARVDNDSTNHVLLNALSTSLITLPTNSYFQSR
jgi:hypothetical protein